MKWRPRPPFMNSLFIPFPSIFLAKKRDDFEGCLKAVEVEFMKGILGVFEKNK